MRCGSPEELGLSEETMRIVSMAGLLHDVGKIGVPESILRKPGRLTADEFNIMKQHPQFGSFIVGGVPGLDPILEGVRSHHERWDGKGYPDGLAAEAIPFMGRLLAVADACSAMITDRPYRKGLAWEDAMEEIRSNISTQFDPAMANAFLRAAHKRRAIQKNGKPTLHMIKPVPPPPHTGENGQNGQNGQNGKPNSAAS
jgi:HD-GYP domain-containing protein (c-di-GMP phosphodiesterase class II)